MMILLGRGVFFLSVITILCCPPSATLKSEGTLKLSPLLLAWASPAQIHVEEGLALVAPLGDLHYLRRVWPHAELAPGENQFPIYLNLVAV